MKKSVRRLAVVLMLVVCLTMAGHAAGAKVTSFSDVSSSYWGYETIIYMTKQGLFEGTTPPVNGVGTFEPKKAMTRAEFITVAMRATYPQEAKEVGTSMVPWWDGFYNLAIKKGVLTKYELDGGALNKTMTREEMAMVMVRCVEQMGESLSDRVAISQIADYATIGTYYQDFVRDCFSYGLLAGVDPQGTFAPKQSLLRAEAATALCRLIDRSMRVEVAFEDGGINTGSNLRPNGSNIQSGTISGSSASDNTQGSQSGSGSSQSGGDLAPDMERLPWEDGGKQPEDYTWVEYQALTDYQKNAFAATFSGNNFFNWMNTVQGEDIADDLPWEDGGKQPEDYTWEEYIALSQAQQEAFFESFPNESAFAGWKDRVQPSDDGGEEKSDLPWENGGKRPEDYTWAEYRGLTDAQKAAFAESFGGADAFADWMDGALGNETNAYLPWEDGGKEPSEYTWEEYLALNPTQQDAFYESFCGNGFANWMENAQDNEGEIDLPWKEEGRDPADYTWKEYVELTDAQKAAFTESFGGADAFADWMDGALGSETNAYLPWENGGKQPEDYTWEEYLDLTPSQQDAFYESFRGNGFVNWMKQAQAGTEEVWPWEEEGRSPEDYTWAEYETLTHEQQAAFAESFGDMMEFIEWMDRVSG